MSDTAAAIRRHAPECRYWLAQRQWECTCGRRDAAPTLTVTLAVRWEMDEDGDPVLWVGPFKAGCLWQSAHEWWVWSYFDEIGPETYATKEAAIAALEAAILKELGE